MTPQTSGTRAVHPIPFIHVQLGLARRHRPVAIFVSVGWREGIVGEPQIVGGQRGADGQAADHGRGRERWPRNFHVLDCIHVIPPIAVIVRGPMRQARHRLRSCSTNGGSSDARSGSGERSSLSQIAPILGVADRPPPRRRMQLQSGREARLLRRRLLSRGLTQRIPCDISHSLVSFDQVLCMA